MESVTFRVGRVTEFPPLTLTSSHGPILSGCTKGKRRWIKTDSTTKYLQTSETESELEQPEIETVKEPEIEDLDFIDDILEDTSNILDSIQETEKTIKILINREQKNN